MSLPSDRCSDRIGDERNGVGKAKAGQLRSLFIEQGNRHFSRRFARSGTLLDVQQERTTDRQRPGRQLSNGILVRRLHADERVARSFATPIDREPCGHGVC